jgi:PAS domain-containing protein
MGLTKRKSFSQTGQRRQVAFFYRRPHPGHRRQCHRCHRDLLGHHGKKEAEVQRARYTREVEESRRELSQIIQGSTIPTFVLNQEHVITHWNRAMEQLTGYPASQMMGTNHQWSPFWDSERPTMADVILDQKSDQEIWDLYGAKWKKSELIDGAYEAEVFFPKLGNGGKWCWFTAAPIKAADGTVVGAIETLWDNTDKKRAESDRLQYTRKLEENQRALSRSSRAAAFPPSF